MVNYVQNSWPKNLPGKTYSILSFEFYMKIKFKTNNFVLQNEYISVLEFNIQFCKVKDMRSIYNKNSPEIKQITKLSARFTYQWTVRSNWNNF